MPGVSKRGLSATAIKLIAAAAMLLDHIAWQWFSALTATGFIMHLIGRITAPVMCFFIAEGYFRTRSVPRYVLRLLVFAVISQVPYLYFARGVLGFAVLSGGLPQQEGAFNMLFTLLLGLLALSALHSRRLPRIVRILAAALCCAASYFCDWAFYGVLFILAFGARRSDIKQQTVLFIAVCATRLALLLKGGSLAVMIQSGMFLALPLLWLYNGRRVSGSAKIVQLTSKYVFYIFYPLHLLIIVVIAKALS